MKIAATLAASMLLTACGGGGGGVAPSGGAPPSHPPQSPTATGVLVDDPSGTPLAGITVRLDPWQWGSGPVKGAAPLYTPPPNVVPGPSPTPLFTTTTDAQGHFTLQAPNGTYLLVIGSDNPDDLTRPTIHDRLVLNGQSTLVAPTMPPVPGITPAPVETNGDYRLVTIDSAHELPCIQDFNAERAARGLPNPVIDEWLTENVRAWVSQSVTPFFGQTDASDPYGLLSSGNAHGNGGSSCSFVISASFADNALAWSTQSRWFAGSYFTYQGSSYSAYGLAEFPMDPRVLFDQAVGTWP